MNKKNKINFIIKSLNKIYPNPIISLKYNNPFTLLVATILSAQTTDKRVNKVTNTLFKVADTPDKMSKLSIESIKFYIKELGLYNIKAKNIYNISKILLKKYQGLVPSSFKELEKLPGVGHKTASIIMSEIFKIPTFPVDTHIHRLMKLWKLSSGKNVKETEKSAKKIFPKANWNKLHLQIILYGREYSPSRNLDLEKDFITKKILQ